VRRFGATATAALIHASEEISRLLIEAARFGPATSIKPSTYVTLLGLRAATGMRLSEALALQVADHRVPSCLEQARHPGSGRTKGRLRACVATAGRTPRIDLRSARFL
jgi:integrase